MLFTREEMVTWPNLITFVRLLCIPVFLWLLFSQDNKAAAAWLLGALGSSDWVDGWVARRFNQTSEFGRLFDPAVDRAMFLVAIPALLIESALNPVIAFIVLGRELAVSLVAIRLDLSGAERLDVTFAGKTGAFMMMFALPMFLGAESTLSYAPLLGVLAWVFAIPGAFYGLYSLFGQYIPEARRRIAAQSALTD
jgi:cardiolipin synthase